MKIVVLDGYTLNPGDLTWKPLEELGEVTVYARTPEDKVVERIGNAEIVFTNKTPITNQVIAKTQMKYIGVLATGYNVVDVEAAKKANILVTNVPTYGTAAVAQFAMALLLELCHHVGHHSDGVFRGEWERSVDWCYWNYPLIELAGKTFGIIGFGKIGQATGRIASALGMNVVYFDQYPAKDCDFAKQVDIDELFKVSDVISLHCPLFESTKGIVNQETIKKMKEGVLLLNTSRGPLIVERDLAEALESGKVAGAAMDVVSTEPIQSNNPLLKAPNCILTPHIAWATKEARSRLMNIAADNLKAFQDGYPVNVVN
ncbi:D-2-hydroxyacid dehydrogenase [Massiliimalia timonensis]|uniref:D-2-hydroxyacid dehydrogenase n=1 Tax=Massiliimalia timonensis TaxID=1987501 RepID=UPI00189EE6F1|nr:D-2-hydroxyacid dehydrogenase [Massiliimalia timonensis]MBS7175401.1 D-2-hydroxyacid dehydrogenase [Clostridiales bacterium]